MPRKSPLERKLADATAVGLEIIAICANVACRYARTVDLNDIARHVGHDHPLLPRRGEKHYSERLKCPECGHRGAYVWPGEETKRKPAEEDLAFRIERLADDEVRVTEVLARMRRLDVAHAVFAGSVEAEPEALLTLMESMRVIAQSPRLEERWAMQDKVMQLRRVEAGPDLGHYGGKRRRKFGR